jgi:phosphoserine phosphatase
VSCAVPRYRHSAPNLRADGEYAGFDEREPTSETGGKARAIEGIRQQHGYSSVVMVGDGVTDLEAKGPADMVIGFGGNVVRRRSTGVAP